AQRHLPPCPPGRSSDLPLAAPDECHARHDSDEQRSPRRKSRKAQALSLSDAKEKQSGTGGKEDAARGVKAADLGSPVVGEGAQRSEEHTSELQTRENLE